MKLEQLRQIIAIEQYKSISKAAKVLYMGQPALSSSLNQLEKKIGVQIFARNPQGVVPTEDGKRILKLAHQIVDDSNLILGYSSQNDPKEMTGTIKVSLGPCYSYLFFDIATRFKKIFPKANLQMGIYPEPRTKELFHQGNLSIAIDFISPEDAEEAKLNMIELKSHRVALFAGPYSRFYDREKVHINELREEKFVAFGKAYWKRNNQRLKVRSKPIFMEDNASIRQVLCRSDMIAIMPDLYDKVDEQGYDKRPRMIPIEGLEEHVFHGVLVYPGNRQLSLLEQHAIQFMKNVLLELE